MAKISMLVELYNQIVKEQDDYSPDDAYPVSDKEIKEIWSDLIDYQLVYDNTLKKYSNWTIHLANLKNLLIKATKGLDSHETIMRNIHAVIEQHEAIVVDLYRREEAYMDLKQGIQEMLTSEGLVES